MKKEKSRHQIVSDVGGDWISYSLFNHRDLRSPNNAYLWATRFRALARPPTPPKKKKKTNRPHFDGLMVVRSPRKGLRDPTLSLLNMFSKVKTLKN